MSPDAPGDVARADARAVPPTRRRRAEIRAYPDGPFLVRGPVTIVDGDGSELVVRRRVVALCRCGRSRRQPLCDGTHTAAGFTCAGTPTANGSTPTLDLRPQPSGGDRADGSG
ncbi:MAG TPA: CDGSH iron-sulfur domain-containing protein [Actinomycetota bacterium]|nr:CDGSH iron-sulfur domain-containing protein [Actinomycetota bacterium]